jgi:hypothetical protein
MATMRIEALVKREEADLVIRGVTDMKLLQLGKEE